MSVLGKRRDEFGDDNPKPNKKTKVDENAICRIEAQRKCGEWIKVCNIPEHIASSDITSGNGNQLLCVSHNCAIIYEFVMNESKAEWVELTKYSDKLFGERHLQAAFNKKTQKLYFHGTCSTMYIYDMRTKKLDKIPNVITPDNGFGIMEHWLFYADDGIHCMGGDETALHQKWDDDKKGLIQLHDFTQYRYIRHSFCIYVSSKRMILLIGGMVAQKGGQTEFDSLDGIWRYSIDEQEWKQIPGIRFKQFFICGVLTNDQKHVIFTGSRLEKIYILDINDKDSFCLRETEMKSPKKTLCHLVKTGGIENEYLVEGYIKNLYKTEEFADTLFPPNDVIELLKRFYSIEMVHWIRREMRSGYFGDEPEDRYQHHMIPVQEILSAKSNKITSL